MFFFKERHIYIYRYIIYICVRNIFEDPGNFFLPFKHFFKHPKRVQNRFHVFPLDPHWLILRDFPWIVIIPSIG